MTLRVRVPAALVGRAVMPAGSVKNDVEVRVVLVRLLTMRYSIAYSTEVVPAHEVRLVQPYAPAASDWYVQLAVHSPARVVAAGGFADVMLR